MWMRNVSEKVPALEELKEKFLLVKQSQHTVNCLCGTIGTALRIS